MSDRYWGMAGLVGYGWECSQCGAWVPWNETHICPTQSSSTGNVIITRTSDEAVLKRILEVLERIEKKLDEKG